MYYLLRPCLLFGFVHLFINSLFRFVLYIFVYPLFIVLKAWRYLWLWINTFSTLSLIVKMTDYSLNNIIIIIMLFIMFVSHVYD